MGWKVAIGRSVTLSATNLHIDAKAKSPDDHSVDGNRLVMVLGRSAAIGLALVTFLLVTLVFGGAVIAPVTVTLAVVLLGRPSNRPGLFATGLLATSLTFWFGAQAATDITAQGMGHLVVPEIALTSSSLVIALATWIAFALRLWRSSPNVSA